jgi:hypothetical protein
LPLSPFEKGSVTAPIALAIETAERFIGAAWAPRTRLPAGDAGLEARGESSHKPEAMIASGTTAADEPQSERSRRSAALSMVRRIDRAAAAQP